MLQRASREALGMDIRDLLELQGTLVPIDIFHTHTQSQHTNLVIREKTTTTTTGLLRRARE